MSTCQKCKCSVIDHVTCSKCKSSFHPSCLRIYKNYSTVSNDSTTVNGCPRCEKNQITSAVGSTHIRPSLPEPDDSLITLLRNQIDSLQTDLEDLKKSYKESVQHMVENMEQYLGRLFDDLRKELITSLNNNIKKKLTL